MTGALALTLLLAGATREASPPALSIKWEKNFDAALRKAKASGKPVLVDFWAEWCGPCHAVAPILDKIAEERADELKLVKVNIDENQGLAQRYGVMSIPMMVLFKDGAPAAQTVGAQPKGALERALGLDSE